MRGTCVDRAAFVQELTITFEDSEDDKAFVLSGVEAGASRVLFDAIREAGPYGVLRSDLVKALKSEGIKAATADRLATRHLWNMHDRGLVRRKDDGRCTGYWPAELAPEDAA